MGQTGVFTGLLRRFTRKPKVVLFAWELGGGMGHIHRLLPIARELAAQGHRVVFALRRLENAAVITQALPDAKIISAPLYRSGPPVVKKKSAYHYADVLHRCGYDTIENLGPLVQRWHELLAVLQPAVIVCDHSPTVVLAAAGRVPVVHIGSGFATPPVGRSFLALYPASSVGAKEREAQVLQSIREVHHRLGTPAVNRVCDLLGLAENVTCCLPDLDTYKSIRAEPAPGPVQTLPPPQALTERQFVFGYLNGDDPRTAHVIGTLVKAKVSAGLYVRQCPPDWLQIVAGSTVTLYPTPQKMPDAIGAAAAILHHGGLSTTETALALGRPQFLFPRNLEQVLTADAVQKMGCGVNLASHGDPGDAIRRALLRGTHQKEALAVATRIAAGPVVDTAALIVQLCVKHLPIE